MRSVRPSGLTVLAAVALAMAAGAAYARCDDGLDGLGAPGGRDLIRIGRDGALALSGMRGCGLALETRIAGRKLSFVTADLVDAWDIEEPVEMEAQRLRFTQAGADVWRGSRLRWTVRVTSAEMLPEAEDLERLASGDDPMRRIGARGMAMTSILRTRDGRAEWLSEMAGAGNGVEQWGMASRQRLRAILMHGAGFRLDGILRHERAEAAFDGPASVLEQDRETRAGGLSARFDQWTVALEHYRSRDNLNDSNDETRRWLGWTGTVRYRFDDGNGWRPREAAVVLNQTHKTTAALAEDDRRERRLDQVELKLAWSGPVLLRLEAIGHTELRDGMETGTARELAVGLERGQRGAGWRWLAAGRIGHLVGDGGFDSESETRLTLRLGAEALERLDLRVGVQAEIAEITPRDEAPYRDATVQLRANLRF